MSIKNSHIIHLMERIAEEDDYLNQKWKYICCMSYTKEKATIIKKKVTCKNCLRLLK